MFIHQYLLIVHHYVMQIQTSYLLHPLTQIQFIHLEVNSQADLIIYYHRFNYSLVVHQSIIQY